MTERIAADTVIVGAGVVGLACARALAGRGGDVIVLERHERFGVETSSRNSEVVHAGIHYQPGSLKATLCARGNKSLVAWCDACDVPCRRLGKLIVAAGPEDEGALAAIMDRAVANGVRSLVPLTGAEVRAREPHVRASAGLWSPDTAIVDSHTFMASLLADAEAKGCMVAWRHALLRAEPDGAGYALVAWDADAVETRFSARRVVNAAGLDADTVAALPGLDVDAAGYRQHYAVGRYFRVRPGKAHLARHLIYPTPASAGLGIHVTLDLAGGVRLGPDVAWLEGRERHYDVDPALAPAFHAAVSRYLEGLEPGDLAPDLAGIRPKLQAPGGPPRDFVVEEEGARGLTGWVNLVGIESPGLTCALEIGELVAGLLEERT